MSKAGKQATGVKSRQVQLLTALSFAFLSFSSFSFLFAFSFLAFCENNEETTLDSENTITVCHERANGADI